MLEEEVFDDEELEDRLLVIKLEELGKAEGLDEVGLPEMADELLDELVSNSMLLGCDVNKEDDCVVGLIVDDIRETIEVDIIVKALEDGSELVALDNAPIPTPTTEDCAEALLSEILEGGLVGLL